MSPFEALYGRKCRIPIRSNPETKLMLGPEILAKMESEVKKIRQNLMVAQDRKKIYLDKKRYYREFDVGYHVSVSIKPKRSTLQWTSCVNLAPKFSGPFQILERVGPVAYRPALPSHIGVHNVCHVSLLNHYVHDSKHVIHWKNIQVG